MSEHGATNPPAHATADQRHAIRRRTRALAFAGALLTVVVLIGFDLLPAGLLPEPPSARRPDDLRVPIAILGDSDSQGYRDTRWIPPPLRGGAYREITLQWTEVLATLRADEVDLGDFGTWGGRQRVVRVLEWFGASRRLPRKQDHRHNFAFAGAHSHELMHGDFRQAPRLRDLMDHEPERWRRGVVVIRIGIIDLGGDSELQAMARDPADPAIVAKTRSCIEDVKAAVAHIRAHHPATRFVLVGMLDNVDCPPTFSRFMTRSERDNIRACIDRYDDALRQMASADPRIAFFDDRQWFLDRWGSREPDGTPHYRTVHVGKTLSIVHAAGDAPTNSVLADNHAGLGWNALWCQSLTQTLAQLGLPVTPVADAEVERFLGTQCARIR